MLAVAANPPPDDKPRVYHAASGTRNPLRFRRIVGEADRYFTEHPLRDRYGQAIGTPSWTYPTRQELEARARTALRVVDAAQWVARRGFPSPIVIGHSNGGMLAVRHVADHPATPALVLLSAHCGGKQMVARASATGLLAANQLEEITQNAKRMVEAGKGKELMLLPGWWYVTSAESFLDVLTECPDTLELAPKISCPVLYVRGDREPRDLYPAEEFKRREADAKAGVRRRYQWDLDPYIDIFEANPDGSELHQLAIPSCGGAIADPTSHGCYDPAWSPDGTKIAFVRNSEDGTVSDIYTVNSDGSGLFQVTHDGYPQGGPDWEPTPPPA